MKPVYWVQGGKGRDGNGTASSASHVPIPASRVKDCLPSLGIIVAA